MNGWRRIGVALVCLWVVGAAAVTSLEVTGKIKTCHFVSRNPAIKMTNGGEAVLKDGRTVKLNARDPRTGDPLPPWEIDWDKETDVPKVLEWRWFSLVFGFVVLPAICWVVIETVVKTVNWIIAGFKSQQPPPAKT